MKNNIKRELLNDVLAGLLVAATLALVSPTAAFAQLLGAVSKSGSQVLNPALGAVSFVSYGIGAVMVVAGIAHAKKHTDNTASTSLTPAIGKLLAGGAFLAAPTMVGILASTGSAVNSGAATVQTIPGF